MIAERRTDMADVLFKVEQQPIYTETRTRQASLFPENNLGTTTPERQFSHVDRFRAIVDVGRNHVFSVVADGYRLIANEEAIELGKKCFCSVFSQTTADGMTVFNITVPKSRSFCHIDFIHKDGGFEPWEKDKWVPFMRVTNSYNRTKPLRFDLGFCRWICTNGMIFGKKSITFRYLHTHGDIARTVEFRTSFGDIKELESQFIERLHNLKRYYVPQERMLPIVCRAFDIKAEKADVGRPKRWGQLIEFRNYVRSLTDQYFKEMGPNGYAALNVVTDFASRPNLYISQAAMVDQLQKRSGDWADDFVTQIKSDSFSFDAYLGEYSEVAEVLNAAN